MGKAIAVLLLSFACISIPFGASNAATRADVVQKYIQQTNKHTSRFIDQAAVLKAKPAAEWTDEELQHYLANSLWAVYSAVMAYVLEQEEMPVSLQQVQGCGYLATWPENPFDDWSPMEVTSMSDDFSPGDFCLQVCPSDYFSYKGSHGQLTAQSYELAVFGPNENFAALYGDPAPNDYNAWALVPDGAVYMVGTYTQPANH